MTDRATIRHDEQAERAARSARAWGWIARAIFAVLVLATLGFGYYLTVANTAMREELGEALDDLAASRAETSALYEQLRSVGESPVVEPGEIGRGDTPGPQGPPGVQGIPGERGATGPMPSAEAIAAADLVVSRSGGSVFELAAIGRPAILVPYPHATGDHQAKNAQWLAEAGAAIVLPDADCTGEHLREIVGALLADRQRLAGMADAARAVGRPEAADRVADEALALARAGRRRGVLLRPVRALGARRRARRERRARG